MKKTLSIFLILFGVTFFTACKPEEPVEETEFTLLTESVEATCEGGNYTILYSLENPAENTVVLADSDAEWIVNINCDETEVISFEILANDTYDERKDTISVSCEDAVYKVPVVQSGLPEPEYDVEVICTELVQASYWGDQTFYTNHNYYINFSDKPVDDFGRYDEEGTYFTLNILGQGPEDRTNPRIPAGTYKYDPDNTFEEWTFSQEHSTAVCKYTELTYEEATLTVSYDGDVCTLDLVATMSDGKLYHAYYNGDGSLYDSSISWLDHDVNVAATDAISFFIEEMTNPKYDANLNIKFIDAPLDDMGYLVPPGNMVMLICDVPLTAEGKIVPGTWKIAEESESGEGIIFPGYCARFYGPYPSGTLIQSYDADNNATVGLVESGQVTVTEEDDIYTFNYEFVTQQGKTVTGSYTGPVVVDNFPQPNDDLTLSADYELYLPSDKIQAQATFFSEDDGSNWILDIKQMDESYKFVGDQLKLDMYCSGKTFEEGPTPGTYTVGEGVGTIAEGIFKPTFQVPSFYVGRDDENTVIQGAAATDGEVTLTKNDDGTYTVTFDLLDAQTPPKHFYGTWTGTFEMKSF